MIAIQDLYKNHDAVGLAELVANKQVSPSELIETALQLTEERNPALNAVVIQDPERARAAADSLPEGPLRGVPFLLKDLYADMKGLPMTNGSKLYADNVPDHDNVLVERYRAAGLNIFGRSASPEFGLTTTTESRVFGQTRNPWNLEHTAGGSSGGAASAVAAGIVPAAHASDGGGSIRIPASCCGLFGLKTTRARVSMAPDKGEGWAGFSGSHAVTRSVRDSAVLLDAVAGPVAGDPYFAPAPRRPFIEEVGADPGKLRIALRTEPFNDAAIDPECVAAAQSAAELCEQLGHHVEEAGPEVPGEAIAKVARMIVAANLRATIEDRAEALGKELDSDDVEPITWSIIHGIDDSSPADYPRAVSKAHEVGRIVAGFFADYDVLITPTMAAPPEKLGVLALTNPDGSAYMKSLKQTIGFTQLMNVAGNPAASVPLHWSSNGLPIGVQFAAEMGAEDKLLRLSAQLEEARPWWNRTP